MNKTNLNTNDVKNILEQIFNGNLAKYRASLGKIAYENANSEKIILTDEGDGTQTEYDLAQYLDLRFYSWKNRLVDSENPVVSPYSTFESWIDSLNKSMDSSYALVELTDSEITPSQDIDSATLTGVITVIAQTNKIANLDYYVTKIRNIYSGAPQDIQNAFGDIVKAYINIGIPLYESEPQMLPIGECVEIRINFTISYLMNALDYTTTPIKLSLDGESWTEIPFNKIVWQNIATTQAAPKANRPDNTGFLVTALSQVKTISFFDFNAVKGLNRIFWECGAIKSGTSIDGATVIAPKSPRIPIWVAVKYDGHWYIYKDIIETMQKTVSNGEFNVTSITLRGDAKE